jgi:hypothetical protein
MRIANDAKALSNLCRAFVDGAWKKLGFKNQPRIGKQQCQRIFLEVFPESARGIFSPRINHIDRQNSENSMLLFSDGYSIRT